MFLFTLFAVAIILVLNQEMAFGDEGDGSGTLIVGGSPAAPGQFPYQVSIQGFLFPNGHFCGGTIYDPKTVITAAHCAPYVNTLLTTVVAGHLDNKNPGAQSQSVKVLRVISHEKYNSLTMQNDIAVIKLFGSFKFNTNVNNVIVPANASADGTAVGTSLVASGWGTTSEGGSASNQLLFVSLPVVSKDDCQKAYPTYTIGDCQVCAGYPEGGQDTCQGDSGGPLALSQGPNAELIVTSFHTGCSRASTILHVQLTPLR